jgi:hypothetical protein
MAMFDLRLNRGVARGVAAGIVAVVASVGSAHAVTDAVGRPAPAVTLGVEAGLACPDQASLERELSAVVPLRFAATADGPPGWSVSVARSPQGVGMVMRDPSGATVMVRSLAVFPTRCEIAAQAIAIIVERYFRDLVVATDVPPAPAGSDQAGLPAPAGHVDAQVAAGPAPAAVPGYTSAPRWTVGLGPAYWTRLDNVRLGLDARVRLGRAVVVGLGTLFPWFAFGQPVNDSTGRAALTGMPVIGQVAGGGRRGRWGGSVGLQGLVSFEKGHTEAIASTAAAWRTVLAAGPVVGAAVDLGSGLRIAADASLTRALLGRSYQVGGVAGNVLEPPAWQALFGVRLEWAILQ